MTNHKTIVLLGVFFVLSTRAMETPADGARRAHQIAVVTQALEARHLTAQERTGAFGAKEAAQLMLLESNLLNRAMFTSLPATGREDGSWSEWWEGFKNPPLYGHEGPMFEFTDPKNRERMRAIYAFRRVVGMNVRLFNFLRHKFWS